MAAINVAEARHLSLPEEIIFEILTRLPARSVIRFRGVCKLWLSITHNPNFIQIQLRRARSRSSSILFFFPLDSELSHRITIVDGEAALPTQILWDWEPNAPELVMILSVSGSCNGLVCFSGHNRSIHVLNPLTMEFLIPPKPTTIPGNEAQKVYFGYHPISRDYKIIRFFGPWDQIVRGCQVYTLGTSSWRQLQLHCPGHYLPRKSPAAVNGTIYWLVMDIEINNTLLAFDIQDERFTIISVPNFTAFYQSMYSVPCFVMELQGTPVIVAEPHGNRLDVWMRDAESTSTVNWTQKLTIVLPTIDLLSLPILFCDEKILLHRIKPFTSPEDAREIRLVYRHPNKEGGNEEQLYHGYHKFVDEHFEAFAHVESLVQLRNFQKISQFLGCNHNIYGNGIFSGYCWRRSLLLGLKKLVMNNDDERVTKLYLII